MKKWTAIAILASAQFVMVLDSSVMNVSITQIVADLNTTVQGVQTAITMYTLVMAAFMLLGAKLGDIWGRNKAFALGLAVYGAGSLITAFSQNLAMLLFGWSLVEGLGAVLVVPAIAALTAANYEGRARALAYSIIGAAAAIGVALGPLIGGWVTTNFTWRYVFVGEVVVVVVVVLLRKQVGPAPSADHRPHLDGVGVALSAVGLGMIVLGILQSSTWGIVKPKGAMTVNGNEITPLGISMSFWLIVAGIVALAAFGWWERRRRSHGLDQLLDVTMLRIERLRAGLTTLMGQQLCLMGTFFVVPVYLQIVLGYDAFETGKRLLPLSVAMLIAAVLGPKAAARRSPRVVAMVGLGAIGVGAVVMAATADVQLNEPAFKLALLFIGAGAGFLASQLGNVIMSSVPPSQSSEAGGLQGTFQNLGASLGTALIGAILLAGLASGFNTKVSNDPNLPDSTKQQVEAATQDGVDIASVDQVEQVALDSGLPPDEATAVAGHYGDAEVEALRVALLGVAIAAIGSLWFTRKLPMHMPDEPEASSASEVAGST